MRRDVIQCDVIRSPLMFHIALIAQHVYLQLQGSPRPDFHLPKEFCDEAAERKAVISYTLYNLDNFALECEGARKTKEFAISREASFSRRKLYVRFIVKHFMTVLTSHLFMALITLFQCILSFLLLFSLDISNSFFIPLLHLKGLLPCHAPTL